MITALALSLLPVMGQGPAPVPPRQFDAQLVQFAPSTPGAPGNASPRRTVRNASPTVRGTRRATAAAPAPAAPTSAPAPATSGPYKEKYAWFWDRISTEYQDANPARLRLAEALTVVPPTGVTPIQVPQAATLARIAKDNNAALQVAAQQYKVSPAFAVAVIWAESGGNPKAVSRAGAGGLMQLMPATAARFEVADRFNPSQNIRGGMEYLFVLLSLFSQDPLLALAGYNAGEGAVLRYDGIPPFAETRDYVPKVVGAWRVAKTLCTVAPAKVTDACVFK